MNCVLPQLDKAWHGRWFIEILQGLAMVGTYPDSQIPRAWIPCQRFWLEHLRAWQRQDTSLRAYAAAKDVSSSSLDRADRRLERRRRLSGSEDAAPMFVPVRGALPALAHRLNLSNGFSLPADLDIPPDLPGVR